MFNKDERALRSHPRYAEIAARRNVLLAGDSLGDVTMADGAEPPYEHVIKFGLLNDNDAALLPQYAQLFDVLVLDDGPLWPLVDLLQRCCEGGGGTGSEGHGGV